MEEKNQIIIYQTADNQTQIDVRMENDTVWLTQAQMAELFQTDRTSIVRHINNIYKTRIRQRVNLCKNCTSSNGRKTKNNTFYTILQFRHDNLRWL